MFEGSILTEIPTALLDNYRRDARGIPHTALWNYLSPGVKVSWDIFDIIGDVLILKQWEKTLFAY